MTDKNRNVDQTLKRQIEESYGASDGQLKARMDRIEKTLTEDEFAGAEDRIMAKLMARITEEEPKTETVEEPVVEVEAESEAQVEKEESVTVTRFGRKKLFLVAVVAAALVGVLGVTAIGEKSYFFRKYDDEKVVVFNSGKNIAEASSLEEAYAEIKQCMGNEIFAMNHVPENAKVHSVECDGEKAKIELIIEDRYLYFIQWRRNEEASIHTDSDRVKGGLVNNTWLNQEIEYMKNRLDNNQYEYETQLEIDGMAVWIFGVVEQQEFEDILKNLYFY